MRVSNRIIPPSEDQSSSFVHRALVLRSVFIISNRKTSNWASRILKANMLLMCPYSQISNSQGLGRKNNFEIWKFTVDKCYGMTWRDEGREMGGAPRNPAPRNHFLVRIVKPSGCHCTDGHLTILVFPRINTYRRMPTPLRSTSPFSGLWHDMARCNLTWPEHIICTYYMYIYMYI